MIRACVELVSQGKRPWGNWKTIKNSCFVASQRRSYWVAGDKRNYQKVASSISERAFGGIPAWITGGVLCAVCVVGSAPRLKTEDWILPIQKHAAAGRNSTPDTSINQSQHQHISHTTQHTRVKQNSLCFLQKGTLPSQTCSWGHMTHGTSYQTRPKIDAGYASLRMGNINLTWLDLTCGYRRFFDT